MSASINYFHWRPQLTAVQLSFTRQPNASRCTTLLPLRQPAGHRINLPPILLSRTLAVPPVVVDYLTSGLSGMEQTYNAVWLHGNSQCRRCHNVATQQRSFHRLPPEEFDPM